MILTGNRADEEYTYRRVIWDWDYLDDEAGPTHFHEAEDYGNVVSGSIELSAFSDLKASCQFSFEGGEPPKQDEMVRIYYSFKDDAGERASWPLGTFFVCFSEVENVDGRVKGRVEGYSVLKVLSDMKCGLPFTISAGENPVEAAASIIESLGLSVVADDSDYTLSSDYTFEPSDSILTVVNWCMGAADFGSVYPDSMGVCQLQGYMEPSERSAVASFSDNGESILYPSVIEEDDWQSTPNVARLYYESDTCAMYAVASNISGSRASLSSRGGRELTLYEQVSELEGDTAAEMLDSLKSASLRKLVDNSSEIERVKISHPYIPLLPNDAVAVDYGDKSWRGYAVNIGISLSPSTKCDTELRNFVPHELTTSVNGEILWEASE